MNVATRCLLLIVAIVSSNSVSAEVASEVVAQDQDIAMTSPTALKDVQVRLHYQIEAWGKTLRKEDFERDWMGRRQLTKPKRIEVCGIFQNVVNEQYRLALKDKSKLSAAERNLLEDRQQFIQSLGYKNNVVDTQMGFNCRLR